MLQDVLKLVVYDTQLSLLLVVQRSEVVIDVVQVVMELAEFL